MLKFRILFLLSCLFGCVGGGEANIQKTSKRPNIVLIMTDDQGYGDLSIHGNPYLKTPNIDGLATRGVRFDRFFVSPSCAPTRAALLTGRYHLRTGVWGVTRGKETMRSEETTIAEILRAAGYRTGLFGKWHNGEQYPYTPQGQGFDEFFGFPRGHANNYFDAVLEHNGKPVQTRGYIADVLTDEALRFVEQNKDKPFFCYLPFNTPHEPLQAPDKYFDPFKAKGLDNFDASVYGMVANIDENIGRVLARLEQLKLTENTIVIFMTDNGANPDHSKPEAAQRFNAGMRERKGKVHEGGTRVPFFIQFPARITKPKIIEQIAAHIDVLPTLLELCHVPVPKNLKLDGRSLMPLLDNVNPKWQERVLFVNGVGGVPLMEATPGAARSERYRWVYERGADQLYDLQLDPGEQNDIAAKQPDIVKQMRTAYEAWYMDVTKAGFTRPHIPVGHAEQKLVELSAPVAYFDKPLNYYRKSGYAHDFLTGWTSAAPQVYWEIDVVSAGDYEVALGYRCAEADAGSRVIIEVGREEVEGTIRGTSMRQIPTPDRQPSKDAPPMEWTTLELGKVKLEQGKTRLNVRAITKSGAQVMDLKHVSLTRIN